MGLRFFLYQKGIYFLIALLFFDFSYDLRLLSLKTGLYSLYKERKLHGLFGA